MWHGRVWGIILWEGQPGRVWGAVRQVRSTFGVLELSLLKYVAMLIGTLQISFVSHLRFWKTECIVAGSKVPTPEFFLNRTEQCSH